MVDDPAYSKLAARLLSAFIDKEVQGQGIYSFSQSIRVGFDVGLINERVLQFVESHARKLNDAIDVERTRKFEYFGVAHPVRPVCRSSIRPCGRSSKRRNTSGCASPWRSAPACTMPSSFTICSPRSITCRVPRPCSTPAPCTNSCRAASCSTPRPILSTGCTTRYKDIALLSKFSGGIGVAWHRVRAEGSLIRSTNGLSNGIVPWLKTLDSSVAAVNQGGKRKGAACVYLETWHADIEAFLELRDNTGDEARRTHHLNLANWVPDLFMRRVDADEAWSLVRPEGRAGAARPVGRRVRRGLRAGRGARTRAQAPAGPGTLRPDDAHPGANRQRLDDLQGRGQPHLQSNRAAAGGGASVQFVHGNSRSHRGRRDGGVQSGLHQPRPARGRRGIRFRASSRIPSKSPCASWTVSSI